jgi:broad specificity phosphatase PhoE
VFIVPTVDDPPLNRCSLASWVADRIAGFVVATPERMRLRRVAGDMAAEVLVVRHGERRDTADPEWARTAARVHDPGLTELGRWAAWRVGRRLAADPPDAVYASPFLRTVETADEICREAGLETALEPGLGEHRNPEWFDAEPETLAHETLAARFATVRLGHEPHVVPSFPETGPEASARVGETARRVVADEDGTVLLVGHGLTVGGVVGGLVGSTTGVDAPLCGLTRVVRDGDGWRLAYSGDTSHLDD